MAKISGAIITSTTKIVGKESTSISKIAGGISTSSIPGWPSSGPTCSRKFYGYSDGRRSAPGDACRAEFQEYALGDNDVLYYAGACGTVQAAPGFYSDGGEIFDFTNGVLVSWGVCER